MIWAIMLVVILILVVAGICFCVSAFNKDLAWWVRILNSAFGVLILVGVWNGVGWAFANLK